MKNRISKSSLTRELMVKSVFMGFISLIVVSFSTNICTKQAKAMNEDNDVSSIQAKMDSEKYANGDANAFNEFFELNKKYDEKFRKLDSAHSEENKIISDNMELKAEEFEIENGTPLLTIEESNEICDSINKSLYWETRQKIYDDYEKQRQEIIDKYSNGLQ